MVTSVGLGAQWGSSRGEAPPAWAGCLAPESGSYCSPQDNRGGEGPGVRKLQGAVETCPFLMDALCTRPHPFLGKNRRPYDQLWTQECNAFFSCWNAIVPFHLPAWLEGWGEERRCFGAEGEHVWRLPIPGARVRLCLEARGKGSVELGIRRWHPRLVLRDV